jgi:hypothetical protein
LVTNTQIHPARDEITSSTTDLAVLAAQIAAVGSVPEKHSEPGGKSMEGVASAARRLPLALLPGAVLAFAQQIGVYGGGSLEQAGSRQLSAYEPLVYPASVPVGSWSLHLNGRNFGSQSVVYVDGVALPVKVASTGLGNTTSDTVRLAVTAAPPVKLRFMG